jgi:SAM-dependent methyltransferase
MERLSLLALALREPREALRVARAVRELRAVMLPRIVEALEPEAGRPWHSWADKGFAHYVYSTLVGEGVARWRRDGSLELVRRPEPPAVTMPEVAGFLPVIDRLAGRLVDALEGRRKYFLDRELILLYARFLDNTGYNWGRRLALRLLLPEELRRREDAVLVDVGAGMGLSTLALLELTRGTVIAVDPYEENLRSLEDYAAMKGLGGRVRAVRGYAENFKLESPADAAVMVNVLHWCDTPREAVRNVARNVRSGGCVAIVQAARDAKGAWTGSILAYLLGSPHLPPTRRELYRMIREEGLRVERSYSLANDLILARVP